MKLRRVLLVAKKQLQVIKHDKRTLALMLLAPIMSMLVFGFAFGTEPKNIKVVIVNQDKGALASQFISQLNHDTLKITTLSDAVDAKNQVTEAQQVAALIFPSNFTSNVALQKLGKSSGASAEVFIDSTNQQLAGDVTKEITVAAQKIAKLSGQNPSVNFETVYAFKKAGDARYIDYFVPGIMAFAVTIFTTLLTLLAFVGERTSGTLDRLRATPVRESEIVVGYEMAFGLIAAVQGILILVVAVLVYHILIVGSVFWAALLVILTAIDAQAIGVLISAGARREAQAVQFLPFIIFPIFLLSGIFVAVESLPFWLSPFSYLLPPTWGIAGIRDVLLRGWGIEHIWVNLLVLVGFGVIFTLLAVYSLKATNKK